MFNDICPDCGITVLSHGYHVQDADGNRTYCLRCADIRFPGEAWYASRSGDYIFPKSTVRTTRGTSLRNVMRANLLDFKAKHYWSAREKLPPLPIKRIYGTKPVNR
jgi:hypothetical protein